jgi:transcriptional regulator GlxA family with amidase domain
MGTKNLYYVNPDKIYEYLATVPGSIKKKHINIVSLAHPRMLATSMTLPVEILRAAAQASHTRPRQSVSLHVMAKEPGNIELANGLSIASQGFDPDVSADILLIPAIWRNPHRVLKEERWQLDLITTAAARGTTICSVGTGSYLLAETGLLDNRVATTHWHWFDDFSAHFPLVKLRRDRLITQSNGLFCVGSVNSIADLMVYLATTLFSLKSATRHRKSVLARNSTSIYAA